MFASAFYGGGDDCHHHTWTVQLESLTFKKSLDPLMTLIGSELLTKVKELGEVSKSDLVRVAGYVSTKKDGSERLDFTAFHEVLLEAKGVDLGGTCEFTMAGFTR
jgi:hypothetical protein